MFRFSIIITLLLFISLTFAQKSTVVGHWKTIDDKTGKALSIIKIYERDNVYYGKVVDILDPKGKKKLCEKCPGEDKGKPFLGLVVMSGLKKHGKEYSGGKILDPLNGDFYKCYITLENEDKLKVRGYIGFAIFGRTQYWYRADE
ncbi:MAG: DUF2147 domain-containing protein [Flavobacterium sp.]